MKSSKVSRLSAALFPSLFKRFSPEFSSAKDTFEQARGFMLEAIGKHQNAKKKDEGKRDFIDAYLEELRRTEDRNSSFYGVGRSCPLSKHNFLLHFLCGFVHVAWVLFPVSSIIVNVFWSLSLSLRMILLVE